MLAEIFIGIELASIKIYYSDNFQRNHLESVSGSSFFPIPLPLRFDSRRLHSFHKKPSTSHQFVSQRSATNCALIVINRRPILAFCSKRREACVEFIYHLSRRCSWAGSVRDFEEVQRHNESAHKAIKLITFFSCYWLIHCWRHRAGWEKKSSSLFKRVKDS